MEKENTSKIHSIQRKNSMRVSGQMGFSDWQSSELIWNSAAESNRINVVICFRFIPHFILNYFKFLTIEYILNQNKHTKSHKIFMPFLFFNFCERLWVYRSVIVYPDYSENRNNRLKKCIFLQSMLTSFVVPDSSINVFPLSSSLLCAIFHFLWHKNYTVQTFSQRELFPTFHLLRKG